MKLNKRIYLFLFLTGLFAVTNLHADYLEGTATTDDSGYGLDGAFRIVNGRITGKIIANYQFDPGMCRGYFNYVFDEITTAPDTIRDDYRYVHYGDGPFYCFVVKDTLKNTYAKVKILSHLNNNRYEYRYGKNTVANNRKLIKITTGMNILPKVSNLFYTGEPYFMHTDEGHYLYYSKTLSWDVPPDSSSLKPRSFIFYQAKSGDVDTSAPINKAEWDTVMSMQTPPVRLENFERFRYFNMVVAYNNGGTSDFLSGWTMGTEGPVALRQSNLKNLLSTNEVVVRKWNDGLRVDVSETGFKKIASLYLFDLAGRKVAKLTSVDNTIFSANTSQSGLNNGSYILQVLLKGGGSSTSPFTLTR